MNESASDSGDSTPPPSASCPAPTGAQASSVDVPPTAPPTTALPTTATNPASDVVASPSATTADDDLELPRSPLPDGYYAADGTPTFDAVAERINQRIATADGNQVLDDASGRGAEETDKYRQLQEAGKDRLAQLRKAWGMDT